MSHPPRSDRDWLDLHLDALFLHDERGRMVARNALDPEPVPRFFLGRTADGNRWRVRDDVPDDVAARLDALCQHEPAPADLREPPRHDARYREALAGHGPVTEAWSGPAYRFPASLPPAATNVIPLTRDNATLLQGRDLEPWLEDIGRSEPLVALVREGRALSVCGSVRITPDAHEAGVETSADARGHGEAVAAVAAWARAVREHGAEPLYSTSWDNAASRAVARKLALIPYAADYHLT